jgi:RNA polymerase sigma-70 factor (ECF subfamily)
MSVEPKRRVRARWVWGGTAAVGGLSAATVVASVIIAGVAAPVVVQPASAAAVEVLNDAAEVVIEGADPVVGPGQYLRVRETYELVSLWDADTGFNTATLPTSEGAVQVRGVRDLYVPSDRTEDWILDDRATNEVLEVWGDPRTRAAYDQMAEMTSAPPGTDADPAGIRVLPQGADGTAAHGSTPQVTPSPGAVDSEVSAPQADEVGYYDRLRPFYDEMPRDPQKLLSWYRENLHTSSDDWYLFQSIGQGLRTNLMPRDLRAASLRVLGLLSDVDVAATNGTITTLALPAELGIGGDFGDLLVSELDIDITTGQIVGIRETYPHRSTSLMPAGVPAMSRQVEITVVDEAPAP